MKKIFLLASAIFIATISSGCATWEGMKQDSEYGWEKTKEVSSETWEKTKSGASKVWDDTKKAVSE